jgi:hypothetical protein
MAYAFFYLTIDLVNPPAVVSRLLIMAKEVKRIPVTGQEQAAVIINRLCQEYGMKQDTQRHQFHVANEKYAAYYDVEEGVVKMEVIHPSVTEEEIKEFLMEFPPFF